MRPYVGRILALWFVVQILLPFTAPMRVGEFRELFGSHHRAPESPTTPTPVSEFESRTNSFVSPLAVSALRVSTSVGLDAPLRATDSLGFAVDVLTSPPIRHAVLRL